MEKLTGLISAPHTPFTEDGAVNYAVIDQYAAHLIKDGVKGIYICGTTGEGVHCTVAERKAIAERWVAASKGQLSITVHTGALSIEDTLDLTRHAETLDIFATSAIAPCFFKPASVEDLIDYCSVVAAAAPSKKFYYYHSGMVPTGIDMEAFLIAAEGKIPNLAGIKFNDGDLYMYQRCLRACGGKFDIPFGVDEFIPGGLACGATGAVGSTYNYAAPIYTDIIAAHAAGDTATIAKKMDQVIAIIRVLVKFGGVQGGKAAMILHGIDCGPARMPLRNLTAEQKAEAVELMKAALEG